jgi:hypothetical protein
MHKATPGSTAIMQGITPALCLEALWLPGWLLGIACSCADPEVCTWHAMTMMAVMQTSSRVSMTYALRCIAGITVCLVVNATDQC